MKPAWPPLPSWWHDLEFILYFATLLWNFSPKREPKIKKTPLLCNKKTKQLSLQQNEGRPSRSGATQRFAGAPSRFLRVSVAFRLAPRTARRAGREHRKTRRTLPVNTMHEFDAQAQKK
jgi:hypothetical protein